VLYNQFNYEENHISLSIFWKERFAGKHWPEVWGGTKWLCGRAHSIITGFTILDTSENEILSQAVETIVHIKQLSLEEIDAYVESKEPLDKAGAYEIQGLGSVIIEGIEGDYFNVVGLPLSSLAEGLKKFGVHVL